MEWQLEYSRIVSDKILRILPTFSSEYKALTRTTLSNAETLKATTTDQTSQLLERIGINDFSNATKN